MWREFTGNVMYGKLKKLHRHDTWVWAERRDEGKE